MLRKLELERLLHCCPWRGPSFIRILSNAMLRSGQVRASPSKSKVLTEIDFPDVLIINNLARGARGEHPAFVDDVRAVADAERLADIVVGDEDADATLLQEADDLLDVEH